MVPKPEANRSVVPRGDCCRHSSAQKRTWLRDDASVGCLARKIPTRREQWGIDDKKGACEVAPGGDGILESNLDVLASAVSIGSGEAPRPGRLEARESLRDDGATEPKAPPLDAISCVSVPFASSY